jgi:hypothetical protein
MNGFDHVFKYKIGDEVRMKVHRPGYSPNGAQFTPQPLVVVERLLQECSGGVQISYKVRAHIVTGREMFSNDRSYNFLQELVMVTEPELVPMEEIELSKEAPERKRRPSPLVPPEDTTPPGDT